MARISKARKLQGFKARFHLRNHARASVLEVEMIKALTACQARGARGMLDWSVRELAKRSKVSDSSIRRIEVGFGVPESVTLDLRVRLQEYFESRGFVFKWSEELGPGVFWNRGKRVERRIGAADRRGG